MTNAETVTSPANPLLKEVRRAVARGSTTRDGYCVAESFHLLEEALRSRCEVKAVLAVEPARAAVEAQVRGVRRVLVLPQPLFRQIAATETSQGVITLVRPPAWKLDQLFSSAALVLVLDGIQDPGNAGAIVRAAEAFGASGVVFLKGTVSPYNPKAVRASAGSVFRVPLVTGLGEFPAPAGVDVYAAIPAGGKDLGEADLRRPCALIIGSEGRGVSERLRAAAVGLRIPVTGVESLNAAMAAGILLYEARRQRANVYP